MKFFALAALATAIRLATEEPMGSDLAEYEVTDDALMLQEGIDEEEAKKGGRKARLAKLSKKVKKLKNRIAEKPELKEKLQDKLKNKEGKIAKIKAKL